MKVHEDIYIAYIPTLAVAVLPYNTMIYYPKLKSNYFHHSWETWHHFTSSQLHSGLSAGSMFNDMVIACSSETKIRQADGIPWFFRPWSTSLLVNVDQTTRQRINDSVTRVNDLTRLESRFLVTRTRLESRWEKRWLDSTRVTFFTEWLDSNHS